MTFAVAEPRPAACAVRSDWQLAEVRALFELPLHDLLYRAQSVHRRYFDPNHVQLSTLLNIKTGGCPEDCAYCPQSARYATDVKAAPLMPLEQVLEHARRAQQVGAGRFCLGAAWRAPSEPLFTRVLEMITAVKALGMEVCATLGMLTRTQAERLQQAGLDYYNHNIDTSPAYYPNIIGTRCFADRIATLQHVRASGMAVCCGGIIGMGEARADRAGMLHVLATLPRHPESVPINVLVRIKGTPLADAPPPDPFELVRMVAVARVLMPASRVRLSAGREGMSDELQALCFHAGANSIFYGERLLTTTNPGETADRRLLRRLGMAPAH